MKIYTRTGDHGTTSLFGGRRVDKDDLQVEAYGCVDELNAALGLARALGVDEEVNRLLDRVQNELFNLGADLATPWEEAKTRRVVRITATEVAALEQDIDRLDQELPPLTTFILPRGATAGAMLHLARSICRRAERRVVALSHERPLNQQALIYLNRLSDWLFVLARIVNARAGQMEAMWKPDYQTSETGE
ncbi:MAG TPA: cob(I)yrinic acid a,c-diamide adenosyltransferase [Anaerolineae bacterium]|nr:cob(I)yrinic acid a,c-diamide adenosyltransferase [Anaerolineae bacterium]